MPIQAEIVRFSERTRTRLSIFAQPIDLNQWPRVAGVLPACVTLND
jgi:hypothetical protein